MSNKRPRSAYTAEYKAEAIKLYDSGLGLAKTARKLGIANQTLDVWLKKRQQGKVIALTLSKKPFPLATPSGNSWISPSGIPGGIRLASA